MRILIYIGLILLSLACTKQDEYKKFINGEERIYRAKPSGLTIVPGYKRAEVSFKLYNPLYVDKYQIYADGVMVSEGAVDYADSVAIAVVLDGLEEQTYQIDVVSVDDKGLHSVKTTGFLNVYGPRFQEALNQRIPLSITSVEPEVVELTFAEAEDNVIKSKLTYLDLSDKVKSIEVTKQELNVKIKDFNPDGNLEYTTYILPAEISLDTVETKATIVENTAIVKKWFSSEEKEGEGANNGRVEHMFDNDLATFWHSQYKGNSFSYPHWFIIDQGKPLLVKSFSIARRQNSNTGPSKIRIEGKIKGGEWQDMGVYDVNNQTDDFQLITVASSVKVRYVRVVALEGPASHIGIAEFKLNN